MAVHTAELERHPVRPDITFLEHVDENMQPAGERDRRAVTWTAVSEKDDVRNFALKDHILQESRPISVAPALVRGARQLPEQLVATMEVDTVHFMATPGKCYTKAAEEAAGRTLQEQYASAPRPST